MSLGARRRVRRLPQMCRCALRNGEIIKLDWDAADELCKGGHARWKRVDLIELLVQISGVALSLKVGALVAFYTQTKANKDWSKVMVSDIMRRK